MDRVRRPSLKSVGEATGVLLAEESEKEEEGRSTLHEGWLMSSSSSLFRLAARKARNEEDLRRASCCRISSALCATRGGELDLRFFFLASTAKRKTMALF
jgi:hypothetical protein